MVFQRIEVTEAAGKIIDQLRSVHGSLMFHLSGGCCDGSSPMCFLESKFKIGRNDVLLGEIHGCKFYMAGDQYEHWRHTHLTIDVTEGRGSSFSLEIPLGIRFIIKSRLFTNEELENLQPVK